MEEKEKNPIANCLQALYELQCTHSKTDSIRTSRGELPIEVSDLEAEIASSVVSIKKCEEEIKRLQEDQVDKNKEKIKIAEGLIKKYKLQEKEIQNNRELQAITNELELQVLDVQLANKLISEAKTAIEKHKVSLKQNKVILAEQQKYLEIKQAELQVLIENTKNEEAELLQKAELQKKKIEDDLKNTKIEDDLLSKYERLRDGLMHGVAVASINDKNACSGCNFTIRPQLIIDIKKYDKIIKCENCARIIVGSDLFKKTEKVIES